MTGEEKALLIGGLGIGAIFLFTRSTTAATTPAKPASLQTGTTLGSLLSSLLRGITGGSSGGASFGAGAAGSGSTGSGGQTRSSGGLNPNGDVASSGNFGDYVVNGQVYDANGNALDDNGNIIPGVFDNSGLGPAGAGINANGTLAADPLTISDPSSALYGTVVDLNLPTATNGLQLPTGDSGQDISGQAAGLSPSGDLPSTSIPTVVPVLASTDYVNPLPNLPPVSMDNETASYAGATLLPQGDGGLAIASTPDISAADSTDITADQTPDVVAQTSDPSTDVPNDPTFDQGAQNVDLNAEFASGIDPFAGTGDDPYAAYGV